MNIPICWLHIGANILTNEKFKAVRNNPYYSINKGWGGLWASPLHLQEEYYSEWHNFLVGELDNRENLQAVIFTLKKKARIYVIDSQEDLIQLIDEVGASPSILPVTFCKAIDFENASKHYDVIYLTEEGQWKTRMPFQNMQYNLYGWDVECCYILNPDMIDKQQSVHIKGEQRNEKFELSK